MATKEKENVDLTKDVEAWEVVSQEEGIPWKPTEKGQSIEGLYEGFTVATDPEGLDGKPRDFKIYRIRSRQGDALAVYGTFKLDTAMSTIKPGDRVRLTFMGKINIGNAQTMNDFQVLVQRAS